MKRLLLTLTVLIAAGQVLAQNWSLVWADEFNGTSLNLSDWNYDLGTGSQYGLTGWGNNELQYYLEDNVEVTGGNLVITALEENFGGMNYTSGKIHTKTKQFWTYGKIEARMQVPTDQGMWPAFWMLTEPGDLAQNSGGWPPELDVMETVGHSGNTSYGTAHYGTWPAVNSNGGQYTLPSGDLSDAFHTYTVEWYPDNIAWYFDGILIHEFDRIDAHPEPWQFNQDFFLIFNLAVGGNWPGSPDGSTTFPEEMLVDWVRVYGYDNAETTDVTFRVDMSDETLAGGDIVYVNGTWNAWCGACNPMTDMGGGIWEVTLPIPPGVHEYKFTTNGWGGLIESFAGGEPCTLTTIDGPNTFVNRVMNVQFDPIFLNPVCFNSCEFCPGFNASGCTIPGANNYDSTALFDDGSCLFDVTFSVDMNCESGFGTVYVTGPWNGWCGNCHPLSDPDFDGVWTGTYAFSAPSVEYKYEVDNWASEENLIDDMQGGASCAPVTDFATYANRLEPIPDAPVTTNDTYGTCGFCPSSTTGCTDPDAVNYDSVATTDDGSCVFEVTFTVDMNCESGFTTVYVVGPFNGWCGNCNPMSDPDLDGIWTATYNFPAGDLEYKYSVDNWASQEDLVDDMLAGASCAPVTNFFDYANRIVNVPDAPASTNDTYGTCGTCVTDVPGCTDSDAANFDSTATIDDGSCVYDVNFAVDMTCAGVIYSTVYITGPFTSWCGACFPLADPDLDNIWTGTYAFAPGDLEYKYEVDDWAHQEDLVDDMIGGASCAPVTDFATYANRIVTIVDTPVGTTDVYGTCGVCPTPGCTDPAYVEYDPYADTDDGSCTTLAVYGCLYSAAENFDSLANVDNGSCTFDCSLVCPGDFDGNLQINTSDLLQFLTYFGGTCN